MKQTPEISKRNRNIQRNRNKLFSPLPSTPDPESRCADFQPFPSRPQNSQISVRSQRHPAIPPSVARTKKAEKRISQPQHSFNQLNQKTTQHHQQLSTINSFNPQSSLFCKHIYAFTHFMPRALRYVHSQIIKHAFLACFRGSYLGPCAGCVDCGCYLYPMVNRSVWSTPQIRLKSQQFLFLREIGRLKPCKLRWNRMCDDQKGAWKRRGRGSVNSIRGRKRRHPQTIQLPPIQVRIV